MNLRQPLHVSCCYVDLTPSNKMQPASSDKYEKLSTRALHGGKNHLSRPPRLLHCDLRPRPVPVLFTPVPATTPSHRGLQSYTGSSLHIAQCPLKYRKKTAQAEVDWALGSERISLCLASSNVRRDETSCGLLIQLIASKLDLINSGIFRM